MKCTGRSRAGNGRDPGSQNEPPLARVPAQTKAGQKDVNNSHEDGALPKVGLGFGICKALCIDVHTSSTPFEGTGGM